MILAISALLASVSLAEYPGYYDGSWFEKAEQRIEKIRKGPITIKVSGSHGPVANAAIEVSMKRHAFPFGSAVVAERLVEDDSTDGERYRSMVTSLFNRVVFENDLKWKAWGGEWAPGHRRERTLKAIEWLKTHNIEIRGHCLVWPGWKHLPADLKEYETDPAALREKTNSHIADIMEATKGNIVEWDVLNETYWNHDLQDILGDDIIVEWFEQARAADPKPKLFINDARIVAFGGQELDHKEHYFGDVEYLVSRGAPIDGIGFQSHFYEHSLTDPEDALAMLDRFGRFGLEMGITEFDVITENEDMQARYLHDYMHVIFSHPGVTEFIMWGFWEGQIFKKEGALFSEDWTPKPSGKMFQYLVLDKWWTEELGQSNEDGVFSTRGFLGNYQLSVSVNGITQRVDRLLTRDGIEWIVEMDSEHKIKKE